MKLILSRKGFDSGSGGCPSPVFPDGTMFSLPIPDENSGIKYSALEYGEMNMGQLIFDLTCGKMQPDDYAHLDPDLNPFVLPRKSGWRPSLGQAHIAQGHLDKQKVGISDLFLFFGLYQRVKETNGKWNFEKHAQKEHILWGWLQVGDVHKVRQMREGELDWAEYHPHLQHRDRRNNTLYMAADSLRFNGEQLDIPSAGIFPHYDKRLVLTAPKPNRKLSQWRLPSSFFPSPGKPPLTYHDKLERWRRSEANDYCLLNSVGRGQEFVLDLDHYPDVTGWLQSLLASVAA
ncbi:MAG: hypothetical protein OXE80_04710 [Gammaproteobacteria bacterium]|nr:hypothetical protein [Gammaproteobacteria bacterium]